MNRFRRIKHYPHDTDLIQRMLLDGQGIQHNLLRGDPWPLRLVDWVLDHWPALFLLAGVIGLFTGLAKGYGLL